MPYAAADLRAFLSERIPLGGSDSDTLFTDEEIVQLFDEAAGNIYAAASTGWAIKAAGFVEAVDNNESGSEKRLSQLHSNAIKMARFYKELADSEQRGQSVLARTVGRSVELWVEDEDLLPVISEYSDGSADEIRMYPLKKFPALKR